MTTGLSVDHPSNFISSNYDSTVPAGFRCVSVGGIDREVVKLSEQKTESPCFCLLAVYKPMLLTVTESVQHFSKILRLCENWAMSFFSETML